MLNNTTRAEQMKEQLHKQRVHFNNLAMIEEANSKFLAKCSLNLNFEELGQVVFDCNTFTHLNAFIRIKCDFENGQYLVYLYNKDSKDFIDSEGTGATDCALIIIVMNLITENKNKLRITK